MVTFHLSALCPQTQTSLNCKPPQEGLRYNGVPALLSKVLCLRLRFFTARLMAMSISFKKKKKFTPASAKQWHNISPISKGDSCKSPVLIAYTHSTVKWASLVGFLSITFLKSAITSPYPEIQDISILDYCKSLLTCLPPHCRWRNRKLMS